MLRILLIDDSPDDRLQAIRELKQAFTDLHITEISGIDQLNQMLEQGSFNLVITDYRLRWSTGLEVLQRVKSYYPHCPVVMFTDSGCEEIAVQGMKLGLSDYVLKGRKIHRLPIAVQESLEKARLRLEYETAAEQKLLSEERYRIISELTSDFAYAYRVEADGSLTQAWMTAAFTRITGYHLKDMETWSQWQMLVHPDDWVKFRQHQTQLLSGQSDVCEFRIVTCRGTIRWLKNFAQPQWSAVEQHLTLIYGAAQDITEHKQAEQDREHLLAQTQAARNAAEQERQRFALLAETSRLLASSLDYRTTLKSVAQMMVPHMAAWCFIDVAESDTQCLGEPVVAAADPAKEDLVLELRRRYPTSMDADYGPPKVMRTRQPELRSEIPEQLVRHIAQDEAHFNLLQQLQASSYMIVPLIAHDRVLGTLSLASTQPGCGYQQADLEIVLEVAHRAAIAIDNARLYQAAQEANRLKDEFLAIVSHELRTPLNAIMGWAQLLHRHQLDPATLAKATDSIQRNVQRQTKLIEDILDISCIARGQLKLKREPTHLMSVIVAAVEDIRPQAEARQIHLDLQLDPSVDPILGDAERLTQVFWNLLTNAVKFTPAAGKIQIQLRQADQRIQVIIRDTGQGIGADFLPYVFERFRQADGSITRPKGGLGLGLAIVKSLVELHDGVVSANSDGEGAGATFMVEFPIYELRSSSAVAKAQVAPENLPNLEGLRILVVDDDGDTRELTALILEQCQAQIKTVASSQRALAALSEFQPHLVLSDLSMPNGDGYTLIQHIRSEEGPYCDIPAIALSAFAQPEHRDQALAAGFQQYLTKPVDPIELAVAVFGLTRKANQ